MIIFPFEGVDGVGFGSEEKESIDKFGVVFREIKRHGNFEKEYMIIENSIQKKPIISIHVIKEKKGIQAFTILSGPAFLVDHQSFDLMKSPRSEIRRLLSFLVLTEFEDQTDMFSDIGVSFYFENTSLDEAPEAILVASRYYLSLLEN